MNYPDKVVEIIIADTQFLVVEGLKAIIERDECFHLAGIAMDGKSLQELLEKNPEALLIIDHSIINLKEIAEPGFFFKSYPDIKVLILSSQVARSEFVELSGYGIKTIIFKNTDHQELYRAIESAIRGKKYYSSELLDLITEMNIDKQIPDSSIALTPTEIEIVKLISRGLTTKEIALRKYVSFHTVNTHRKNIFRKMGVSNISELMINAIKQGWIDPIEYYI